MVPESAGGRLMPEETGASLVPDPGAGLESGSTRLDLMDLGPGSVWVGLEPGPRGANQALGPLG